MNSSQLEHLKRLIFKDPHWFSAEGCWIWPKSVDSCGYGRVYLNDERKKTKNFTVHRVSWELKNGPIPKGRSICHKCDTPRCFNPDHLFLGTHKDNMQDRVLKNRTPRGEKHPMSLVTAEMSRQIISLAAAGVRTIEIAKRFGISENTARKVKSGRHWSTKQPLTVEAT